MKLYLPVFVSIIASLSLSAQESSEEGAAAFLDGNLYSRLSIAYQQADDYHSGYNSAASSIFENNDGGYTFVNYSLDLVYIMKSGLYIGTGVYASAAEVSTDGLGGGIPDTDSDVELREIPLAIGYDMRAEDWRFRFEARYIFNIDGDFDSSSALENSVILPATDGSDSLTLSVGAKRSIWGLEHSLLFGYQTFENDVEHPLFPKFTLGDRYFIDYEIAKVIGEFKLSLGHLHSQSQETNGTPSVATGTAYLTEKPRYSELRIGATYRITPRLLIDGGLKYTYSGKDAPKQETAFLGLAYIF
jgi:hypothetical protein